jgi:hypothetical protein
MMAAMPAFLDAFDDDRTVGHFTPPILPGRDGLLPSACLVYPMADHARPRLTEYEAGADWG